MGRQLLVRHLQQIQLCTYRIHYQLLMLVRRRTFFFFVIQQYFKCTISCFYTSRYFFISLNHPQKYKRKFYMKISILILWVKIFYEYTMKISILILWIKIFYKINKILFYFYEFLFLYFVRHRFAQSFMRDTFYRTITEEVN